MTRIVVDAMGSDAHPIPDVAGAVMAARELGVEVILVGNETIVGPALAAHSPTGLPISVVHAPEVIDMEQSGQGLTLKARHGSAQNSMAVGIGLVKDGKADAFITAGNTGAAMVTSLLRLGRLRGVDRPANATAFPTATGPCLVLDVGVNPDCKPENLLQFAVMGSIYAKLAQGKAEPRVGLLSNGEEEGKGNALVRAATPLLKSSGLNYFGNVEGKEIVAGKVDVVVADGFVGNVMIKTSEAVARLIIDMIKTSIRSAGALAILGGLLVRPALSRIRRLLDPSEYGAAILLGVNGLVLIGHGRSDAKAIMNAVRLAKNLSEGNLLGELRTAVETSLGH